MQSSSLLAELSRNILLLDRHTVVERAIGGRIRNMREDEVDKNARVGSESDWRKRKRTKEVKENE